MTDMSAFRYASLASIGSLVYVGIVLISELPAYSKSNKTEGVDKIAPLFIDGNIFTGASMNFFAFQCQV